MPDVPYRRAGEQPVGGRMTEACRFAVIKLQAHARGSPLPALVRSVSVVQGTLHSAAGIAPSGTAPFRLSRENRAAGACAAGHRPREEEKEEWPSTAETLLTNEPWSRMARRTSSRTEKAEDKSKLKPGSRIPR